MYLEKLRIFGFKSFAHRVEVNFPKDGITSILGPNGCGKSNIVDAIRWVMGEQKVKQLRSNKMEDVIFSGTSTRPPMNMAEVSLIVNNDQGILPSEYSQVMITRQVYRNGESVYLLNNQPCRLKDIHNLFYDTGMGATSYSLMEARMIDSILSDKDEERRVLFEEASGISKYKKQRQETKRQLEKTAMDLGRVDDNLRHTRQNVALFERQAKKAEEWKALKQRYRGIDLGYHRFKYNQLGEQKKQYQKELGDLRHLAGSLETEITLYESTVEERKLGIIDKERAYSHWNQVVANTSAKVVQLEGEMQRSRDRIAYLTDSLNRRDKDKDASLQKMIEYQQERAQLIEKLRLYTPQKEEVEKKISAQGGIHLEIQAEQEACRKEVGKLNEDRMRLLQEQSDMRSQYTALEREVQMLERQMQESKSQRQYIEDELEEVAAEYEELSGERNLLVCEIENSKKELADLQTARKNKQEQIISEKEQFHQIEKDRAAVGSRMQVLQKLHDSRQGVSKGTQYLLKNHPELITGVLLDTLQVAGDNLSLAETGLGYGVQTVLVEGSEPLQKLLHLMHTEGEGSAYLFNTDSSTHFVKLRPKLASIDGVQGFLIDRITVPDSCKPLIELWLGNVVCVDSLQTALACQKEQVSDDVWWITPQGERIHSSGLVQTGREGSEGLLQQKADLENSRDRMQELEARSLVFQETLKSWENELREMEAKFRTLDDAHRHNEKRLSQIEARDQALKEKQTSLESRRDRADQGSDVVKQKLETLRTELEPSEIELAQHNAEKEILEKKLKEKQENLAKVEQSYQDQYQHLREMESQRSQLIQQIEAAQGRLSHIEEVEHEQSSLQTKMDLDGQEWVAHLSSSQARIQELEKEIESIHQRLDTESKRRDEAKSLYDTELVEIDRIREQAKSLQNNLHQQLQKVHSLEIKEQQVDSQMQSIRERMYEIHEIDIAQESLEFETEVAFDPATVETEIQELKEKLRGLGNINLGALEEYEAEKSRLEEVQKQFNDLERARTGLEKAIRKLDKVAREQFLATFEQIQENFQKVFSTLFEGGQAKINLEENADPLDAKIEINASPSGKKMRGVTLLSGGERALTAISLLFSLYLVRPSPYCIMDEVDGPLDDANIGRFVNLLRRFSNRCQFLVVTHNKRTMAASDILYGVTQEVKGISQLASVRLDEASLIVA